MERMQRRMDLNALVRLSLTLAGQQLFGPVAGCSHPRYVRSVHRSSLVANDELEKVKSN